MKPGAQLYRGGQVYTVDPARPEADAVAVRDGWIITVGSEKECRSALGSGHETLDLGGRVLLPGFIDTHLHPTGMVTYMMYPDLSKVAGIEELQERMRSGAREIAPPEWVVGLQFEDQKLREPRLPSRHDLDAAIPDRPAVVVKADAHMVIANTRAIQAAKLSAKTVDPQGGRIDRENDGYPAGPFREAAAQALLAAMPMPDMQRIMAAAKTCFEKLASRGITSAGVMLQTDEEGILGKQGAYDVMLMNALMDFIPINLCSFLVARDLALVAAAQKTRLHQPKPGAGHKIAGIKFWADGTFGSCTAYMSRAYADQPDKRGFLIYSEEEMYRRMVFAHTAGLQIAVHVIGDAACRTVVELYRRLLREYPRPDHRHRLEHASLLDAGIIADIARLGLVVSSSPLFVHLEKEWLPRRLGPERAQWAYPFRALLDAGVKVAGASDAPASSTDVLHAIQCAITREGFVTGQGVTVEQAIRMFTIDAAYAQFEDDLKGSIRPGKRADFVALSGNPAQVPADKIRELRVEAAVCGGKIIYQSPEFNGD